MSDDLRAERDHLVMVVEDLTGYVDRLRAENAKLRELAKDLFWYIDRDVWSHTIFDRAHELGIGA